MTLWFYIIESENPEKALERINKEVIKPEELQNRLDQAKDLFNASEEDVDIKPTLEGQVIDEDRILTHAIPLPSGDLKNLSLLADVSSRLMEIHRKDSRVCANLFNITENGLQKIDEECSRLSLGEAWRKNSGGYLYQGYSHLPAYFYHKHDFKMFDRETRKDVSYQDLYNPQDFDKEYRCSLCNSNELSQNGWEFKCENCGFEGHETQNTYDISGNESNKVIIEFLEEKGKLFTIGETTLMDALNQRKGYFEANSRIDDKISYLNNARRPLKTYKFQDTTIRVNGNAIISPYDYKLSGSEEVYPKYNIELPSLEEKNTRLKKMAFNLLKHAMMVVFLIILLSLPLI